MNAPVYKKVELSKIAIDVTDNVSRAQFDTSSSTFGNLGLAIALNGYDQNMPVILNRVDKGKDKPLSFKDIDIVYEGKKRSIRASDLSALRHAVTLDVKVYDYQLVAGYYRIHAIYLANRLFAIGGQLEKCISAVSALVYDNLSYSDISEICIKENALKSQGNVPLTMGDELHASKRLYDLGLGESKLTELFTRYKAQKYFALCKLDAQAKGKNVLNRIVAGQLKIENLKKEDIRIIASKNLSPDEIEAFLTGSTEPVKKTSLSKTQISDKQTCAIKIIAHIAREIVDGNNNFAEPFLPHSKELNALYDKIFPTE